jgi:hypothetical protein
MARVLTLALLAPCLLLTTFAALPALIILPFCANGTERAIKLIAAHTSYARALLHGTRPASVPLAGRDDHQRRAIDHPGGHMADSRRR